MGFGDCDHKATVEKFRRAQVDSVPVDQRGIGVTVQTCEKCGMDLCIAYNRNGITHVNELVDPSDPLTIVVDASEAKPMVEVGIHTFVLASRPDGPEGEYSAVCDRCGAALTLSVSRVGFKREGGRLINDYEASPQLSREGSEPVTEADAKELLDQIYTEFISPHEPAR